MKGFVLIDRLVELDPGVRVAATKSFASDDTIFGDHFPGNPLVPGSLLIEAMAQTAGWLVVATTGYGKATQLVMVKSAKFRRAVRPGDAIALSAEIASSRGAIYELKAEAHVAGELAADARLVLQTFDLPEGEAAAGFVSWAEDTFRAIGGDAVRRER